MLGESGCSLDPAQNIEDAAPHAYTPEPNEVEAVFDNLVGKFCSGEADLTGKVPGPYGIAAKLFRNPDGSPWVHFRFDGRGFVDLPVRLRADKIEWHGAYRTYYSVSAVGGNRLVGQAGGDDWGPINMTCA
jgi:hypothetical protein